MNAPTQLQTMIDATSGDRRRIVLDAITTLAQLTADDVAKGTPYQDAEKAAKKAVYKAHIDRSIDVFMRDAEDVVHLEGLRTDSVKGLYLQQNIRAAMSEVFTYRKPELEWIDGGLVPISTSLPMGAESYTWQEIDHIGEAGLISSGADDVPMADVEGRSFIQKVHDYGIGHQYTDQDLRRSAYAGQIQIATEKMRASALGMTLKLDKLAFEGDTVTGHTGIINTSGILHRTAATSGWASSASAAQVKADFSTAYQACLNSTSGVERPDTVVLPIDVEARLMALDNSTGTDTSVLTWLKMNYPGITSWRTNFRMSTADYARTGPAMLMYRRSPDVLQAQMPFRMLPVPLQRQGFKHIQLFSSAWGGLKVTRPKAILVLSGI